jgi:hypothetical protein
MLPMPLVSAISLPFSRRDLPKHGLGEHIGRDGVGDEHVGPGAGVVGSRGLAWLHGAGIGDQQIEPVDPAAERGYRVEVPVVELLDPDLELVELVGFVGLARRGDHVPAVSGILAGELEPDAAVGAGDQD